MTAPSIFQLLPHRAEARFLDEHLRPLNLDLYDPAVWRRYQWSAANGPAFRDSYARGKEKVTLAELDAYFEVALARARRFEEALDVSVDSANAPVKLYAFGGDCEETLTAPVVLRDEKRSRWLTLVRPKSFRASDGGRFERADVLRAMFEPGDGRVTRASLLGTDLEGPRASAFYATPLPVAYAAFACDLHSDLQSNKTLQDNALTLLINELIG
jgi:hypothetical protein